MFIGTHPNPAKAELLLSASRYATLKKGLKRELTF
jgi:hypothetical protein